MARIAYPPLNGFQFYDLSFAMPKFMRRPPFFSELIATVFFSGYVPYAPGTAGSIAALVPPGALALFAPGVFLSFFSAPLFIPLFLVLWLGSHFAVKSYLKCMSEDAQDPGCIVIDEALGIWLSQFIALFALSMFAPISPTPLFVTELLATTFVTFRCFDIMKPWPISWCDRTIKGPLGIILDDLVAGLFAGLVSAGVLYFLGY